MKVYNEENLAKIIGGRSIEGKIWYGYGYQLGMTARWNLSHPYFQLPYH